MRGRANRTILLLCVLFLTCSLQAKYGGNTDSYIFITEQSNVIKTGGIAGVHETYPIEGQFHLTVDANAAEASFSYVDAILLSPVSSSPPQSLGELFNMAGLEGTIVNDLLIEFSGKTADGTNTEIALQLTFDDDTVRLTGQTIVPPNSADFFVFNIEALAKKKYGGGTGEPDEPYLIYTAEQLNTIGLHEEDANKHFKLMADIDLSGYKGDSFNRIGYYALDDFPGYHLAFKGVFDGNGHKISNFTYVVDANDPSKNDSFLGVEEFGLFGNVSGAEAQIKNLGLIDPNIYPAMTCLERVNRVGAIAGTLYKGSITNCYVEGGKVSGDRNVGGLVGSNLEGIISDCYTTCEVRCAEKRPLRPLEEFGDVGYSIGGLVGFSRGWIYNCYTTGNIQGIEATGGLAGQNDFDRTDNEREIGIISDSYASGNVTGEEDIGGLVGSNNGTISGCYALGNVSGSNDIGGLVGNIMLEEGCVSDSYASGNISGNKDVGGLVGYSNGLTEDSYASGEVSGTQYVGGLIGFNGFGTILRSYAIGDISGESLVGGLAGSNLGMINCCYAGSLVPDEDLTEGDFFVSTVTGDEDVGGLVGENSGDIIHCYCISAVAGNENIGGLVGENRGSSKTRTSFWDTETSGLVSSDGGIGRTTEQMRTASTFLNVGWDFMDETKNGINDIWWIDEGQDYPRLWWELSLAD
jgi:hypothetical protein